jgi:hypothetical protein
MNENNELLSEELTRSELEQLNESLCSCADLAKLLQHRERGVDASDHSG